jgi:hypothetical protein
MIPMNCPNCDLEGFIPNDRLNSRLHCRSCGASFYMDSSGRMVLGEPSKPGQKAKKSGKKPAAKSAKMEFDFEFVDKLKQHPKAVIGTVLGVAVLYFVFSSVDFAAPSMPPITLLQEVVRAGFEGDKTRLQALATSGTGDSLTNWSERIRKDLGVTGTVTDDRILPALMSDPKEKSLFYVVLVSGIKKGSDGKDVQVPIGVFIESSGGKWLVDGGKTLDEARKTGDAAANSRR